MENLNLTDWLEMVWNALNEPDEVKRDQLLHAADVFLQEDDAEDDEPARASSPNYGRSAVDAGVS